MPPARFPRRATMRGRALLIGLVATLSTACVTAKPKVDVRWPAPPDPARVQWVKTFRGENELSTGVWRSIFQALIPTAGDAIVGQPTGLALSPDDKTLWIASGPLSRVLAVNRELGRVRKFDPPDGQRPGAPFSVGLDAEENLYVSDSVAGVVWVYSPQGKFLRKFGKDRLERPTGLAIDRRRQLVYVVSGAIQTSTHHRIEVFSLSGDHVRTIGTRGGAPGEFNFPSNLAVSKDGTLFVVDMLNFRIQMFDPEGRLVGFFGEEGTGEPGSFDKAKAVALDSFGNIYVTESRWGYVQIFNAKQQCLMAFSGQGGSPGSMQLPTAIVIDSKNTIFVADYAGHTVSEFKLLEVKEPAAEAIPSAGSSDAPSTKSPPGH